MSHHLYKKAMEYDLEEIQLLAKAAQTAPPPVAQALLGIIKEEAQDAEFWNTLYSCCDECYKPPCPDDPDGIRPPGKYYPYQKKPEQDKKE
ncbi:MAG TPA: hypothetical protein GX520_09975 [Syntrophaceticus sp.]|jgi:hypothetical protein|uniref:Uncharacterized protein n=1 Tax=Syntrophaceticus schinkii TaxID=499207 RepID=A0A0B7MMT5_9FIRM|nr:hypothetical protein [Syntrophaceticus schinkii]HHY30990.1 hypothetical protein [Syntrophaceticus sp.]MDD2360299.1 hypothetical protein [Syntrophaceticus schinkii]MDD4261938.1 hypothetical protein [Syntrophaceticus schinkii]MDD4675950.1 hypothetical protein [Syntrophaceticus schinkii]CEO88589.1 conserved hypothetical protein [Syntrophaceticus schinkii]